MNTRYIDTFENKEVAFVLTQVGNIYIVREIMEYYNERDSFDYKARHYRFKTEEAAREYIERRLSEYV